MKSKYIYFEKGRGGSCVRPSRDLDKLKPAAEAIKEGKLIVFPTETVYGLGADALNIAAVNKIYEAKRKKAR